MRDIRHVPRNHALLITSAIIGILLLRILIGPFRLQGGLFLFVVAFAAWRGPGAAALATVLTALALHVQLVAMRPDMLTAPWELFTRQYIIGVGALFVLCAILIQVSARHYRVLEALESEQREKKHIEGELLERLAHELRNARRLAAIVESSDDAIIAMDLDGHVKAWNRAAERTFGYTAEEMVGRSIRTIIPRDRDNEETYVLTSIRHGEKVDHFDTIRQSKDGRLIPVSLTVSPIRDGDGTIIGASKIARDITDRRRAEVALADLQQRLLALVVASGSLLKSPRVEDVLPATLTVAYDLVEADGYAVWRRDPVSNTWHVRSSAGVSEEFAAHAFPSAGGETDAMPFPEPLAIEEVRTALSLGHRRASYEAEGIQSLLMVPLALGETTTGTVVFYYRTRHSFTTVEVETAKALGNLAATALTTAELYDVQDRHRRESDFLAEVGSVLGQSLDYTTTLKQVANLAVPQIADWCAVDLVGTGGSISRLAVAHVDPARLDKVNRFRDSYAEAPSSPYSVAQVIRTGQPAIIPRMTDEMMRAGARSAEHLQGLRALDICSFMIVPMTAGSRTLGAMTFVSAESGRFFTRADLQFAESIVSRAALAVDNARAYGEARAANQLKDEFLATLSHELRTPLNAIVGYARMLRTGVFDAHRQTRGLEILERNATALTQIVDDLLDVSGIIAGKVRLNMQPVDLAAISTEAMAAVRPSADAKEVVLDALLDRQTPPVSGDPDRLRQVVWNLLTNAVKFTPAGGQVGIQLVPSERHVELVISDTGKGIAPEFLPHVFERFRQADSRFSREHGGLGLGLAICRDLVEMHGGSINAESKGEGQGATFRVLLPAMIGLWDRSRDVSGEREVSGRDGRAAARLDGIHVLAVDDEADALTLVREILEASGARVTTAKTAEAAYDALRRVMPQVLVADIGMPGTDGLELMQRVRQSPDRSVREISAAALTAYARSDDRNRVLRAGFQTHLTKPVDPSELVAIVAALANREGR